MALCWCSVFRSFNIVPSATESQLPAPFSNTSQLSYSGRVSPQYLLEPRGSSQRVRDTPPCPLDRQSALFGYTHH